MAIKDSSLLNDIWALINERLDQRLSDLGLLGDSGTSTVSLTPSDYPDALLQNGSRPLLGDLAVGVGITIDNVQLASFKDSYDAHAAANAVAAHGSVGEHDHQSTANGGTLDHGLALTGLGDDDHSQYVHLTAARTINAQHTFAPGSAMPPFLIGTNGQGQTVAGLKADQLNKALSSGDGSITGVGALTADRDIRVNSAQAFSWTAQHTFAPGSAQAPFVLGANAQGQLVTGLRADQLNKSVIAGNGLITGGLLTSDVTLNVGAGNGITVSADAVAVNQAYTFAWTGAQTFAASIIFNGAVTINNDALFTDTLVVGTNVLYVDPVGQRVGINGIPDAQFALDVYGNVQSRGYFVGKHALQIPDATAIMHFDGKEALLDFTGSAIGHKGQLPTITGGVIYRKGKFGKGIAIAEATTNKVKNPVAGTDTTNTLGTTATVTRIVGDGPFGTTCFNVALSALVGHIRVFTDSFAVSTTYALSGWVKGTAGQQTRLALYDGVSEVIIKTITLTGAWQYFSGVAATTASATRLDILMRGMTNASQQFRVAGLQVEQKAYPTPIAVGHMGTGHSWSGTAHASTSLRTAGKVLYAASEMLPVYNVFAELSFSFWLFVIDPLGAPAVDRYVLDTTLAGQGYLKIYRKSGTDQLWVDTNNNASTGSQSLDFSTLATTEGWHHIAWTYTPGATANQGTGTLYLDGVSINSGTAYLPITSWPTSLAVGSLIAGGSELNGILDDLCIVGRTLPASEVLAIYTSNAPVFAESSVWGFQTPNTLAWANEYGLFAIDNSGNAAFGVSGVNAYSWGGATLDKGDILIGRIAANVGSVLWDASAATLSLTGVLNIGTAGGIWQGTGTFTSPTTGLKMSNSGGVGILEGYKSGVLQARFNSSGEIEGGAGAARLNEDGFQIESSTVYAQERAYSLLDNDGISFGGLDGAYNIGPITRSVIVRATHDDAVSVDISLLTDNATNPTQRKVVIDTHRIFAEDALLRCGGESFPADEESDDLAYRTDLRAWFQNDGTDWRQLNAGDWADFPASPATGLRIYHTEFRATFVYDGSVWRQTSVGSFSWFPSFPTTMLRVFRTDQGMEFFYDGTRWLSSHEYSVTIINATVSGAGTLTLGGAIPIREGSPPYITHYTDRYLVSTTNDDFNFWTITFAGYNTARSGSTTIHSHTTTAGGVGAFVSVDTATMNGTAYPSSNYSWLAATAVRTGTPGALSYTATIFYRLTIADT